MKLSILEETYKKYFVAVTVLVWLTIKIWEIAICTGMVYIFVEKESYETTI